MARRYRVGVLGLGHWYSAYRLGWTLAGYPRAELAAVACADGARRDAFATAFGIDGHASFDELLARGDVDIVHVCPPVAEIPEATIKAARAGKHVILGKPMAMTVAQADQMVEAVRAAGIVCLPFQGMFRLAMAGLKRRIDQGEIGDLILIHAGGRWSIAEDWFNSGTPGWFVDPRQTPGGALIDEGIYAIDQLRWLAGSEVVAVEARIANLVHKEIPVEDYGFATFTYANGVVATLESAWTINSPRKSGPSPKENSVRKLELVGSRGEIVLNELVGPGLSVLAAGASRWIYERPAPEYMAAPAPGALDHLIDCLEGGRQPVSTIEDARTSLVTGLAAYEAARKGAPVRLA
ncbi:MAG TPA: Gfo/Idh/MocA family oxidoreductase [Chloroflexota bacterium]